MKHFNKIFDLFLYESIFVLLFGGALYLLDDPTSKILITAGAASAVFTVVLGITGYIFGLFKKEDPSGDF